jgi:hypothetical protein
MLLLLWLLTLQVGLLLLLPPAVMLRHLQEQELQLLLH